MCMLARVSIHDCVYVCMCACVTVCGCFCAHLCACICMCARVMVCRYLGGRLCVCMFTCTCLCAHELVCVLVHSCVCTHVHVHAWVAMWDALCVHIRTQGRALNIRSLGAPLLTPRMAPCEAAGATPSHPLARVGWSCRNAGQALSPEPAAGEGAGGMAGLQVPGWRCRTPRLHPSVPYLPSFSRAVPRPYTCPFSSALTSRHRPCGAADTAHLDGTLGPAVPCHALPCPARPAPPAPAAPALSSSGGHGGSSSLPRGAPRFRLQPSPSHLPLQPATATCTPGAAASTWSCTSSRAGRVAASASTAGTTLRGGTATTARRASTGTSASPSPTARPAKVLGWGWDGRDCMAPSPLNPSCRSCFHSSCSRQTSPAPPSPKPSP